MESSLRTSTVRKRVAPRVLHSDSGTAFTSSPITIAPSSANRRTHAAPIPEAPPVTNATRPSIRPLPFIRYPSLVLRAAAMYAGSSPPPCTTTLAPDT